MMARLKRALARVEDHWLGDTIGSVSIFVIVFGGLFIGCGLGMK